MSLNIDVTDPQQLIAAMQSLSQQVEKLNNDNQHLKQILAQQQQPIVIENKKEPNVDLPDKFSGKQKDLRNFMACVTNIFELQSRTYNTDRRKTGLIGSLCTHDALNWYRSLQEQNSELLYNYDAFIEDMKEHFGDPHMAERAKKQLLELTQGKGSAASYAAKFRRIAADTGFNQETLCYHFERGLKSEVRRAIAVNDYEFDNLDDLVKYAIKVDNRIFEASDYFRPSNSFVSVTPAARRGPVPMEIGSVRVKTLGDDEKKRRIRENLCLYCAEKGHIAQHCPKKTSKKVTFNHGKISKEEQTPKN